MCVSRMWISKIKSATEIFSIKLLINRQLTGEACYTTAQVAGYLVYTGAAVFTGAGLTLVNLDLTVHTIPSRVTRTVVTVHL